MARTTRSAALRRIGAFREAATSRAWIDGVALGDMNNDGLLDVCVGTGNEIAVYLNQTPDPGNFCDLFPRMERPNLDAAGDLGKKSALPLVLEKAHPDGTPAHVGPGSATAFDLRVPFRDRSRRSWSFEASRRGSA